MLASTPASNTRKARTLAPRSSSEPPTHRACLLVEESGRARNTQRPRRERRAGIKPTKRLGGDDAAQRAAMPPSKTKQTNRKKSNFLSSRQSAGITHVPTPVPSATYEQKVMSFEEKGLKKKGRRARAPKRDDK